MHEDHLFKFTRCLQPTLVAAQAFQRFSGWTWFMAGLTYAMVWLVLPIDIAKPLSVMVVLGAVLLVATQLFRLRRTRRTA